MTASSPWTLGMIDTRKSIVLPLMRSRNRPSCGTRFSAMSSSAITLMREMIGPWNFLSMGRIAGCSTPSIRYLTWTASSCVSMWMSLARRWIDVNTVESINRMIGLVSLSAVRRSTVRFSSPFSSSRRICSVKLSVASSSTRWELSLLRSIDWMAEGAPTVTLSGVPSSTDSSSIIGRSVGSDTTITSACGSRRCGTNP